MDAPQPGTFGPINLVIIQPTSFCNLACDYCYLPDRERKNQLSLDLIDPIFKSVFTSPFVGEGFTVCWHAGEPLAVPVDFYRGAFARIEEAAKRYDTKGTSVVQSVQTNAIPVNQAWCDLFLEHHVDVGVSVDGPAFLHDAHRKTRAGTGSHAATMRGLSMLQKNDIPFNAIAVITEESLDHPDEIFAFFMENGILDVGFNMEEKEGVNRRSSLDRRSNEGRYRAFMQRIWDLIAAEKGAFRLREFETLCNLLYFDKRLDYTDMNAPFVIVNYDYQGNFSTFDPELLSVETERYGKFVLGNVLTDTLESVCSGDAFRMAYREMRAGVALCKDGCQYFGVCGGGAGSNKYWENGTFQSSETQACRYRTQIVTDIILDELEKRRST